MNLCTTETKKETKILGRKPHESCIRKIKTMEYLKKSNDLNYRMLVIRVKKKEAGIIFLFAVSYTS